MKTHLEIRAAEGGDDAVLFCADLARAYEKLFDRLAWKHHRVVDAAGRVDLEVTGHDLTQLKYEAGGHRIQRVPPTEKRGRVHTSTVTVAVVRQPDSVVSAQTAKNGCLDPKELSYRWHSGTGKGGQHRNKHQNCLELTHVPTGLKQGANGRCRITNEAEAMSALQAKVSAQFEFREHSTVNSARSDQIGSGMRGDKRRTYRFQDDSVMDHETGKTSSAKRIMKGAIDDLWR